MSAEPSPRPAERRREQQRAEVRREILDATGEMLVAGGFDAFSIRRLVRRCGYSAPTIYHHFGDKSGLLHALLEERFATLAQALRRVPATDDPLETLRRQLRAFVRFGIDNPAHYRLLTEPRPGDDAPPTRSAEESRGTIEETLVKLAEGGRLLVDEIEEAVQCIWVMLHGLISMQISRPDYEWTPNHVEVSLEVLLRGLVAPEPGAAGGGAR